MYETIFSLNARPFATAPRPGSYVALGSAEQSRTALSRVLERAAGPGLLIGAAGSGKTLLCHVLAHQYQSQFQVAMLGAAGLCTRRALLQSILFELGLPYRDREEGELRLALLSHLTPTDSAGQPLLLLVDEADSLPLRLLEELRMLTNIVHHGEPQVRLVLAGGPALEEHFAAPKLESFNQRIAARCYLQSLGREETSEYVKSQLACVGGDAVRIFSDGALDSIYTASDGIPRLVNQICDHALTLAAVGGRRRIDSAGIEEAWSDLQQLPTPWNAAERSGETHVVEFGTLAAEDSDLEMSPAAEMADDDSLELATEESDPIAVIDDLQRKIEVEVAETPAAKTPAQKASAHKTPASKAAVAATSSHTEVELVFHPAPNPFAESFEDEEVVFDRFAPRHAPVEVASEEPEESELIEAQLEIEAALEELAPVVRNLAIAPETQGDAEEHFDSEEEAEELAAVAAAESPEEYESDEAADEIENEAILPRLVGADDPVLPVYGDAVVAEETDEEVAAEQREAVEDDDEALVAEHELAAEHEDAEVCHDDRDLIIIEEDQAHPIKPPAAKGRARRQEYRQLFARLRRS
ncbi:ExeA family protein [Lignipirellula cremea]|uniref:AAA+ ATPase domain-containing protein n=1 Tax=Lignipirellula cremea TaxID=2528010 RepID=A0A518DTQ0_9BACT|nr:AAA family ATPase [Lignipirellula cremea]QDU95215.1 hypothetical protein Pla8534_30300 [Lignipirellula cremea]